MDNKLYEHPAFAARSEFLSVDDRVLLAYHRAKAVLKAWSKSLELLVAIVEFIIFYS